MADNEEKEKKAGLMELESLDDLIQLLAGFQIPVVNHVELNNKHYYFIAIGGLPGFSRLIYYFSRDEAIKKKFINYDSLEDKYSFGDKLERRGGIKVISIINIKRTNVIKPEDFNF